MNKHFVLIHGAWHGGWAWEGVIEALNAAGCTAEAPTMPGHEPQDDRKGIAFEDYVKMIVETINSADKPVVLVGHSSAGFMMQAAAPLVKDKIDRLIFHNAFILPDGKAQFDLVPPEVAQGMIAAAEASPDNCVPVDEEFVRGVLMAGASKTDQDSLIGKLAPQPLSLFQTQVDAKAFDALDLPKTVLFCKDDISLPEGAYLGMAAGLGEYDLIEIDGGHETLWTNPGVIAEKLIKAAK